MKKVVCLTIILAAILAPNIASAEKYYYHEDHLGGASIMTDEDGEIVAEYQYYPYGGTYSEEISGGDFGNSYKYTGQEEDSETGLYYYGARYYNLAVTKFMSQDPAVYDQRLFEMLRDPQMLNTYAYVRNNPIKYTDPSGEYVVETGVIESGDTKDNITQQITDAYGIDTNWDQVAELSFFDSNLSIEELVGLNEFTALGTDYVVDVTAELDWLNESRAEIVSSMYFGYLDAFLKFHEEGPWDLKNSNNNTFGIGNKYNAYIYHNKFIRHDAPGNIHFGYVMNAAGYSYNNIEAGANIYAGGHDNTYDLQIVKHGYYTTWDKHQEYWKTH